MLTLLPPAKTFDTDFHIDSIEGTHSYFSKEAYQLVQLLRKKDVAAIEKLMKVGPSIARLTVERFAQFKNKKNASQSKQALYLYNGETVKQLSRNTYSLKELRYLQSNVRFISGLYGLVSPFDSIQPYRLEMKIKIAGEGFKNVYEFWEDKIAHRINEICRERGAKSVFNAASLEYAKVINPKKIDVPVVNLVFQEKRGEAYKVIGTVSKKARGAIADYVIKKGITDINEVKHFNGMHYIFSAPDSTPERYIFKEV